jgi:acyl carrier protein
MSDRAAWPAEYEDVLRQHLPLAGDGRLRPDAELVDLGLDSLGLVALLVDIEETFRVEIPDELLNGETFASVGALWTVLAEVVEGGR